MDEMEDCRKDGSMDAKACVRVSDRGDGLFVLHVDDAAGGHRLCDELAQAIGDALSTLTMAPELRALVVEGGEYAFLHGGRSDLDAAMAVGLYRALLEVPVAVVAAVRGDATGAGFLFAALCDFVVCGRDAECGFTRLDQALAPSTAEFDLFAARFGVPMAWDLLYRTPAATAGVRSERGWTCRVAAADVVVAQAERLARDLAAQATPAQRLLRDQRRAPLIGALNAWTPVGVAALAPAQDAPIAALPVSIGGADGGMDGPLSFESPAPDVLLVRVGDGDDAGDALTVVQALEALTEALATTCAKALVLVSAHPSLLPGGGDVLAAGECLRRWVQRSPLPIVVAVPAAADGRGCLLATVFDAVVHADHGFDPAIGAAIDSMQSDPGWFPLAASVFGSRLPLAVARELVFATDEHPGLARQVRHALSEAVPLVQVERRAIAVAQTWAEWPSGVIAAARDHAFPLDEVRDATAVVVEASVDACADIASSLHAITPGPLRIASPVVEAVLDADGILSVRMLDLDAKNLFTPALVQGLGEVFAQIAANPACKVVVLSGYDRFFSTGGTRETLQDIQAGKTQFTDSPVFITALRCPVPVVAAMQGHAVGGGLSLGLFADFALFATESQYLNPYLRYGFTPGGGATLIVPEILGSDLGHEALYTALEYAGGDLHARNSALAVHPRTELPERAIALARRLARHPRERLVALKAALNRPILNRLDAVFAQEIDMHAQSFVGKTDALERIHAHFGPYAAVTPVAAAPVDTSHPMNEHDMTQATSSGATPAPPSRDEIIGELRTLLARELHLSEHEIGEGVPFVDLGLDSITGVTWVRQINDRFGTSLPATRVYSHPTLIAMVGHLEAELSAAAAVATPASVPVSAVQPQPQPLVLSRDEIVGELRGLLAQELHLSEHEIGESVPFVDLGLDSITGVTWVRNINARFDIQLPATQVYSHPTLVAMTGHIEGRLLASAPSTAPALIASAVSRPPPTIAASAAQDAATPTAWGRLLEARGKLRSWRASPAAREVDQDANAIAIVGMAGQFPQARDIDAYWVNLAEGRLCVEEVPRERWDMAAYYQPGDPSPGKANARWMGCLPDYDRFDPMFFDISPKEAISMDPQQRVFLQTAWHAIEHAGYNPRALSGSRCGVFVGCGPSDYHLLSGDLQSTGLGFTGNDTSILAARVSYVLNLQGPCLTVETACSSSMVAIAVACDNLVNDTCDAAVAGGVGIIATQHLFLKMAQTGMLSPDGRCFTFDQRANGFVPGEAVGALLLKRLADAERDGDEILGLIRGWGVNQDGKTNGITAPNPDAQARLQQDVHTRFGIDPAGIQMVEAHGTGTKLGDPIEVEALKRAFAAVGTPDSCALGSVKSNIGHCFTAAGVASVIKVLLSLRHATMPPTINYARLNEHIDLKGTPFYINDRLRSWPAPASGARMAAVSSFGFGGTNAHLVIGEYVAAASVDRVPDSGSDALHRFGKLPFVLSARTIEQLDAQVRQLLDLLTARGDRIPLTRLAYTLQIGREAMDERLGLMASTTDELVRLLRRHLVGETDSGNLFRGAARDHRKTMGLLLGDAEMCAVVVDRLLQQRHWSRLLELWTHGLAVDWTRLYGDARPRRLGLPGYAFAKQRYWVESAGAVDSGATAKLHPLVHRNASTLRQHVYTSSFRSTETFMTHPEGGEPGTLPASACLEMARAAIDQAWDGEPCAGWRLTDIAWGEPYVSAATGSSLSVVLMPTSPDSLEFEIYSRAGDVECVHCQGQAQIVSAADMQMQAMASERSLTIDLPELGLGQSLVVHPWLIESVLRGLGQVGVVAADAQPVALASLWVSAPCRGRMTATVVRDAEGALSAALYDAEGRLSAGLAGLQTTLPDNVSLNANDGVVSDVVAAALELSVPSAPQLSRAELVRGLRESLARALYLQPGDIANDKAFIELGLDSIVGVEWINALNKTYGIKLAAARLYDYPTLDELATHLEAELAKQAPPPVVHAPSVLATVATATSRVAVAASTSAARLSRAELVRGLRESLARALYLQPGDIANDKAFIELGLDSIVGVEWINALNKTYGIKLAAARLYDYPTLDELATHLEAELAKQVPPPVAHAPSVLATVATATSPVAVAASTSAARLSRAELVRGLRESLARALYLQPGDIANDKAFIELGLDSIVGVEWINALNKTYGIKLAAARLYDYPTLDELAIHLEAELTKQAPPILTQPSLLVPTAIATPRLAHAAARRLQRRTRALGAASVAASTPPAASRRSGSGKIAVIGMSGRYPQAGDLSQYWANLCEGRNAITEVPPSRWDVARFFDPDPRKDGGIYCKWIGMLDDIESFDPLFFRISPAEAKNMDPQHRLFLEESYRAFEHAGYARQTLSGSKCGVYVGIIGAEYASLVSSAVDITGSNLAIGAARIAYFLNLKGPAIAIDTACSASLVAIHLGCQGLLSHETDMALAGGVSVYLHPETYMGMCRAGMLSPDGLCRTFDDRANGFVPGEGVGAVVLKRLEDAERDNDTIYGVILGSAINQDGKTNGITAPSVNSQIELERGLYADRDIHPETISYIETHGTGTKLGDPIELEALSTVFRERTQKQHFCGLGSVKSNIGHASGAAGVASVQKVLLSMQHRTLVPSLHVTKENTLFDFADSPFYVSKTTQPWGSADDPLRRAAVSSFGFSGTNAHLVIEEYIPSAKTAAQSIANPLPVVLSARTAGQLMRRVRDLQGALAAQRDAGSLDLPSIAYTLLEGREALDERFALVVRSIDELMTGLEAFLEGAANGITCFSGKVHRDEDGLPRAAVAGRVVGDIAALAQAWVYGDRLTWTMLKSGAKVRRIALPTYPFAAKRYWVDHAVTPKPVEPSQAPAASVPLTPVPQDRPSSSASAAVSDPRGYRLDPATIASCMHAGDTAAPAAAFLEIVRMSLADTLGQAGTPVLGDVIWGQPLQPTSEREIQAVLFPPQNGLWAFEIHSAARGTHGPFDEQVHCQGLVRLATPSSLPDVDIAALRGRLSAVARTDEESRIETVFRNGHELLVSLRPQRDTGRGGDLPARRIDLIDTALRATAWLSRAGAIALADCARPDALQAAFDGKDSAVSAWRWVWVRPAPGLAQRTGAIVVDIDLCDVDGAVVLRLAGVTYDRLAWASAQVDPVAAPAQAPAAIAPSARPRIALAELE
jgi:acyl transferase domain-containing protein/enoyl-CoA hydratase/carnithine racemase/acyl carrier protein